VPRTRARNNRRLTIIAAGIVPVLLVALLKIVDFPLLGQVSGLVFDSYQRLAPRPYEDAGVRVVDIDDETIRRLGQWPWPRSDVAELAGRIAEAGAAAIAFDIVFSEPDRTSPDKLAERARTSGASAEQLAVLKSLPDHDTRLAEVLGATPSVLGLFLTQDERSSGAFQPKAGFAMAGSDPAESLTGYRSAILPLPAFQSAAPGLGFVSIRGDADGIIRRVPLLASLQGKMLPSLSAEALRVAQGAGGIIVRSSDSSGEVSAGAPQTVGLKVGDFEVPLAKGGEMWMHYTAPTAERTVPAWRVLSGDLPPAEMERLFGGNIVFIGAGAIGLRDLVSTPVRERELGVVLHAQAAEQMVLGAFLERPDWVEGLEMAVLLLGGLLLVVLLPQLGAFGGAALAWGLVLAAAGGSWYAFRAHKLLIDPSAPALAFLSAYVVVTLLTYFREERQRQYIHQAFDRYLSPELVKRITADPSQLELGGQERQMTVLFCDIRGFSRISEQLVPREIIDFLIAFLTPMTEVLLARKATIDKYIGDAILAFWNAPLDDEDQYRNAARAALAMKRRLGELNEEMPAKATAPWPGVVEIGIGLNAGPCCVGNMGSAQRLSYSLIGDTVNLASRIEGLTKQYGVSIALGQELAGQLKDFAILQLDCVCVVGRERPETVHVLVGDEQVALSPAFAAFRREHEAMLQEYHQRRWKDAQRRLADQREAATAFGLSRLYDIFSARIATYAENPPPADWNGVFSASEK
jgi:adenylate cyclase